MKKFNLYREVKSTRRQTYFRPDPTKVGKTIEAEDALAAARIFLDQMTSVWDKDSAIIQGRWRGSAADLWVRRFTKGGRYQGETYFMIWEV